MKMEPTKDEKEAKKAFLSGRRAPRDQLASIRKAIGKPKKAKVVPATKDDVLARLSKVVTGNLQTSVGSLTRLMVKTYNDDKAAEGSGKRIKFADFGDHATDNMMLVHKPLRKSFGGKAPRKQLLNDNGEWIEGIDYVTLGAA